MSTHRTTLSRRQLVKGLALTPFVAPAAIPLLAAAQQQPAASPAGAPPKAQDREIVVELGEDISTLDDHMHSQRGGIIALRLINDHFLIRDLQTMRPKPNIISEWKAINDTTWEFKLRSGVKFHTGDPVTANDAKFSFDRVLNPAQKSPQRANITWVKEVKVLDPLTFQIVTDGLYPLVLERLVGFSLVSEKYIKEKGDAAMSERPVGSGPYKFVSWRRGAALTLERNEDYWGEKGILKRIIVRTIPDDATKIAELLAGNVHVVRIVPPDQIKAVNASKTAEVRARPILRVVFMWLDAIGKAGPTPFQNLKVRQAANLAVDKKAIVEKVQGGYAQLIEGPLNTMHFGFDPELKGYPYDPDKAKQLLAEAGYPNGVEIDLNFCMDVAVVEAVQGYWAKVGIKANMKDMRSNVAGFVAMQQQGKLKDCGNQNWGSFSVFDADALMMTWFHHGGMEADAYTPELEKMLEDARKTLDENKRKQLYFQAQKYVVDQAYWVPLYARYTTEGVNRKLVYRPAGDEYQYFEKAYWMD